MGKTWFLVYTYHWSHPIEAGGMSGSFDQEVSLASSNEEDAVTEAKELWAEIASGGGCSNPRVVSKDGIYFGEDKGTEIRKEWDRLAKLDLQHKGGGVCAKKGQRISFEGDVNTVLAEVFHNGEQVVYAGTADETILQFMPECNYDTKYETRAILLTRHGDIMASVDVARVYEGATGPCTGESVSHSLKRLPDRLREKVKYVLIIKCSPSRGHFSKEGDQWSGTLYAL